MRALLGIVLLASSTLLWAQDHEPSVVEMIDRSEGFDFSSGLERHEDGWVAFSVPAIEGTKSYCCWNGYGSDYRKSGCNLDSRKSSYLKYPHGHALQKLISGNKPILCFVFFRKSLGKVSFPIEEFCLYKGVECYHEAP